MHRHLLMSFPESGQQMGAYSADKMVCGLGTLYPALYTGSPTETLSDVSEMHSLASCDSCPWLRKAQTLTPLWRLHPLYSLGSSITDENMGGP